MTQGKTLSKLKITADIHSLRGGKLHRGLMEIPPSKLEESLHGIQPYIMSSKSCGQVHSEPS